MSGSEYEKLGDDLKAHLASMSDNAIGDLAAKIVIELCQGIGGMAHIDAMIAIVEEAARRGIAKKS